MKRACVGLLVFWGAVCAHAADYTDVWNSADPNRQDYGFNLVASDDGSGPPRSSSCRSASTARAAHQRGAAPGIEGRLFAPTVDDRCAEHASFAAVFRA